MSKPKIIGLTGYIGSGKDATAALLRMIGYTRISFADEVREEVVELIKNVRSTPVPEELWRANGFVAALITRGELSVKEVWAKPTSTRMRWLLQWWGTEYRRSQNPDYWVRKAENTVARHSPSNSIGYFVFTDVRFPNEVEMIKRIGGVIWRIERVEDGKAVGSDAVGSDHVSEKNIDLIKPDLILDNSTTLYGLAGNILSVLDISSLLVGN